MSENPWKTLATRVVYENAWVRLREDAVVRPDGQEGVYSVVELRPSVGVVALNDAHEVLLVGTVALSVGAVFVGDPTRRISQRRDRSAGGGTTRASRRDGCRSEKLAAAGSGGCQ